MPLSLLLVDISSVVMDAVLEGLFRPPEDGSLAILDGEEGEEGEAREEGRDNEDVRFVREPPL